MSLTSSMKEGISWQDVKNKQAKARTNRMILKEPQTIRFLKNLSDINDPLLSYNLFLSQEDDFLEIFFNKSACELAK